MRLAIEEKAMRLKGLSLFCPPPIFTRICRDWDIRLAEVDRFVKKNGRLPIKRGKSKSESLMGIWCQNQRRSETLGILSEDKKKKLNAITGWYWCVDLVEEWNRFFNQLVKFVDAGGDISPLSKDRMDRELKKWCRKQRFHKLSGKLLRDREISLGRIKGWWWGYDVEESKEQVWQEILQRVKEFVNKYGRIPYGISDNKDERFLASWCVRQKADYRNGKMPAPHSRALKVIKEWKWGKNRGSWDIFFEELDDYVKVHGEMPAHDSELSKWCHHQKEYYRKFPNYANSVKRLERREKLNSIPVWIWNKNTEERWDSVLDEVKTHVKEEGVVPSYKCEGRAKRLANWCMSQRCFYSKGILSQERQKKLETIPIWWWNKRK